ncbi:Glutaredoxin family protein [Hirschfeldia incana]|nr:Glutaredoxin family protein [Hirschfeldia incana]
MKSSRMKFAKKLKSIRAAGEYLNQDRILQVLSAADEFLPKMSNPIPQITAASSIWKAPQRLEHQTADATELVENENIGGEAASGNEENILPPVNEIPRDTKPAVTCGSDRKSLGCGFRRPELNSITLFDPKLLEAFELAVGCFRRINDLSTESNLDDDDDVIVFSSDECGIEDTLPPVDEQDEDVIAEEEPLSGFEERCPPGGEESVVFYTTTLRGIRKTFDDCNMIRFLLDSFKVKYYERDVSMHVRYREELRRISEGTEVVLPPVLFVKGRCIGGAQRVLGLHEQGKFRGLFDGVPLAGDTPCGRCDGFRFLMCEGCRGSRRIVSSDGSRVQCLLCNENGLVVCVDCSS